MPELPEVETVRRGLEPAMVGRVFRRVETRRPDLRFPFPERMAERLHGRTLEHLGRRSKYLVARVSGGDMLIMHLGMSGRFTVSAFPLGCEGRGEEALQSLPHEATPGAFVYGAGGDPKHDHVVFEMADATAKRSAPATRITYNDPRRFGFMVMVEAGALDAHPLIRDLGPEPLGNALDPDYLAARAAGRKADLKAFLMDQRNIAGLGNIYVAEALFRAGLSPSRASACLADTKGRPTERAHRLVPAIRQVLEEAIAAGGSTLRDYRAADGALGYFQHSFSVYDREGKSCLRPGCGGTIRRIVQSGRSTFYCPGCQR